MKKKIKSKKVSIYFRGFLKGIKILLLYFLALFLIYSIIAVFLLLIGNNFDEMKEILLVKWEVHLRLLSSGIGFLTVYWLIRKYNLMIAWILPAIFFSAYIIPFMMGQVELKKLDKSSKSAH